MKDQPPTKRSKVIHRQVGDIFQSFESHKTGRGGPYRYQTKSIKYTSTSVHRYKMVDGDEIQEESQTL